MFPHVHCHVGLQSLEDMGQRMVPDQATSSTPSRHRAILLKRFARQRPVPLMTFPNVTHTFWGSTSLRRTSLPSLRLAGSLEICLEGSIAQKDTRNAWRFRHSGSM